MTNTTPSLNAALLERLQSALDHASELLESDAPSDAETLAKAIVQVARAVGSVGELEALYDERATGSEDVQAARRELTRRLDRIAETAYEIGLGEGSPS